MYCLAHVTCPDLKGARAIADALLEEHLIACANIIQGVESRYWWQDKKEKSSEVMLFLKTRTELFERLEFVVRGLHPYDVPEIVMTRIEAGHQPYLDWIMKETKCEKGV